jgi:hypothetical protein
LNLGTPVKNGYGVPVRRVPQLHSLAEESSGKAGTLAIDPLSS